jgi:putative transposase
MPNNYEAPPFDEAPRVLIRDRDHKYGQTFKRAATGSGIEILKTPYRSLSQRDLRAVSDECAERMSRPHPGLGAAAFVSVDSGIRGVLHRARPHPGIEQKIPERSESIPDRREWQDYCIPSSE